MCIEIDFKLYFHLITPIKFTSSPVVFVTTVPVLRTVRYFCKLLKNKNVRLRKMNPIAGNEINFPNALTKRSYKYVRKKNKERMAICRSLKMELAFQNITKFYC